MRASFTAGHRPFWLILTFAVMGLFGLIGRRTNLFVSARNDLNRILAFYFPSHGYAISRRSFSLILYFGVVGRSWRCVVPFWIIKLHKCIITLGPVPILGLLALFLIFLSAF